MRSRRLLVTLGLALVLAAPLAGAQSGPTVDTQALVDGEPLEDASPLEPRTAVDVPTTISTQDGDAQWRAFVNVTVVDRFNRSQSSTWNGSQQIQLDPGFQAPREEGLYTLGWTVVVQNRTSSTEAWQDVERIENTRGFEVREPTPPPDAGDVTVEASLLGNQTLEDLANLTPNQGVNLELDVTLPERDRTQWQLSAEASVNGTQVDEIPTQGATAGSNPLVLRFNAPGQTGEHELSWQVKVQYRDDGDEAWTNLTTRQDSSPMTVQTLEAPEGPGLPWGWILAIGGVAVLGGGGAYYVLREPKQIKGQPRSQAMQDLEGDGGAATTEPEEPEVHPQVKILEARAEDLRRMIELARERHEEGEITEHQFEQIRERKEAELEEVEAEIEEYRQDSAGE